MVGHVDDLFVLVHSPFLGPASWRPVAEHLYAQGRHVLVPKLVDHPGRGPYWAQHAESVEHAVGHGPPVVLVAHSGAGPLVPEIAARLEDVSACVFVDAMLFEHGASRLDLLAREDPTMAATLATHLGDGGRFPEWSDEDLRGLVPDDDDRADLLRELTPRAAAFFLEPLPAPDLPPDAVCGYLQLTPAYEHWASEAEARGWRVAHLDAGHFHAVVEPSSVAERILELAARSRPSDNLV
jgi:hypothetical protein